MGSRKKKQQRGSLASPCMIPTQSPVEEVPGNRQHECPDFHSCTAHPNHCRTSRDSISTQTQAQEQAILKIPSFCGSPPAFDTLEDSGAPTNTGAGIIETPSFEAPHPSSAPFEQGAQITKGSALKTRPPTLSVCPSFADSTKEEKTRSVFAAMILQRTIAKRLCKHRETCEKTLEPKWLEPSSASSMPRPPQGSSSYSLCITSHSCRLLHFAVPLGLACQSSCFF